MSMSGLAFFAYFFRLRRFTIQTLHLLLFDSCFFHLHLLSKSRLVTLFYLGSYLIDKLSLETQKKQFENLHISTLNLQFLHSLNFNVHMFALQSLLLDDMLAQCLVFLFIHFESHSTLSLTSILFFFHTFFRVFDLFFFANYKSTEMMKKCFKN